MVAGVDGVMVVVAAAYSHPSRLYEYHGCCLIVVLIYDR